MDCPRCGFDARDAAECPRCGVVFGKLAGERRAKPPARAFAASSRGEAGAAQVQRASAGPTDSKAGASIGGAQVPALPARPLRLSLSRRAALTSALATMTRAGLPITELLGALAAQTDHARERAALEAARARLLDGDGLVAAFEAAGLGAALGPVGVALLSAGEATGRIDEAFGAIASAAAEALTLRRELVSALLYPVGLLVLGCFLLPLRIFVFEGPWPYLRAALAPLLFGAAFVVAVVFVARLAGRRWPSLAERFEAMPVIGAPSLRVATARAASTWGALLDAGLAIAPSLTLAGRASGRVRLARLFEQVGAGVDAGDTLADAFARAGAPEGLRVAVSTGERAGTLPASLRGFAALEREAGVHALRIAARLSTTVFALGAFAYLGWRSFAQVSEVRDAFERALDGAPGSILPSGGDLTPGGAPALEEGLKELRDALE